MKTNYLSNVTFCTTIFFTAFLSNFVAHNAHAQDAGVETAFKLGRADGEKILRAYIAPAPLIIGVGMAEGWYFTAQPLKKGAWNIQFSTPVGSGNVENESYDMTKIGLTNTAPIDPAKTQTATVLGYSGVDVRNQGNNKEFVLGEGLKDVILIGSGIVLLPNLQLNVGLKKNTELSLRLLPTGAVEAVGISVYGYGAGIKHDIKQWIPSISLSNFSLAMVANFSYFNFEKGLTPTSTSGIIGIQPTDRTYKVTSLQYGGGLVFSKRIKLLTLMTGLRFDIITGTGELRGTYSVYTPRIGGNPGEDVTTDIGVVRLENSSSRIGLNLGAKLKLGKFGVFTQITVAKYPSANFGFVFGKNE